MKCYNCNTDYPDEQVLCPHCGSANRHSDADACITNKIGDIVLGIIAAIGLCGCAGVGLAICPVLYMIYRNRYPYLVSGILGAWLALIILVLGAFAVCFHVVFNIT